LKVLAATLWLRRLLVDAKLRRPVGITLYHVFWLGFTVITRIGPPSPRVWWSAAALRDKIFAVGGGIRFCVSLSDIACPKRLGLLMAIGLEVAWEVIENTPLVMDRYRQSALARGYFGDSVINSVADTLAATFGFVLARLLPVWAILALVIGTELFTAYAVRDNLTLNIIQLIRPSEPISQWQMGN
jgi:hypothetical protein